MDGVGDDAGVSAAPARVAMVTGAAKGIGAGISSHLADEGWSVLAVDVGEGVGDSAAEGVESFASDLSTGAGATAAVDAALDRFGRLDALVNNAGGGVIRPFMDHDEDSIAETISRNLLTAIHCCQAAIPELRKQGDRGRIVNIGAESVRCGLPMHAMYNAAKGGVHGLTTGLARDLAPDGVTVNCVAPSIVETDAVAGMFADRDSQDPEWMAMLDGAVAQIPLGRASTVEEVSGLVGFLLSEQAAFVTGQVISVNGGSSML